jgi:hypothetical protein
MYDAQKGVAVVEQVHNAHALVNELIVSQKIRRIPLRERLFSFPWLWPKTMPGSVFAVSFTLTMKHWRLTLP